MRIANGAYRFLVLLTVLLGMAVELPLFAQDGKLKINAHPPEAYVFVDGNAMGQANHTFTVTPGEHKIQVQNYGYKPATRTVTIATGEPVTVDVTLEAIPDMVSGPRGCITIEGANRDAVLLNGKTPDFFVGHGDEFNHEWWWKQELIVPPGTHQLTIVRQGNELWSGAVDVPVNQRVVVDIPKGVRKTVSWPRGEKVDSVARFKAGSASATVAVAKPTAQLSAENVQISCGESSQLKWNSTDAGQVEIVGIGPVAASGEQSVQPKQATTYELRATGPGGTATSSTTVNLNSAIQAKLDLSPAEVRYKSVGGKVVEQGNAALNWTVANANAVAVDPLGTVGASGTRTLEVAPRRTEIGPVDETIEYTLTATNPCGGSETRTAKLHIVGSIEPEPEIAMRSIYFPTDLPKAHRMQAGLVSSEQQALKAVADAFKQYMASKPDARLILSGHADRRGPASYNQALSDRRAQVAKDFLVEQGIPAQNIETQSYGEERNLSAGDVKQLLENNPDMTEESRQKAIERIPTITFAHNRRVDIVLSATGQESARNYPFKADDFTVLVKRGGLAREVVVPAGVTETTKDKN